MVHEQAAAFIVGAIAHRPHARSTCPVCSDSRKKKRDQCLSISRKDDGTVTWLCHHCGFDGAISNDHHQPHHQYKRRVPMQQPSPAKQEEKVVFIERNNNVLSPVDIAFMASRGISEQTCKSVGLFSTKKWFKNAGAELPCIAFPYRDEKGQTLAHKYRTDTKQFTQDAGGAGVFFGIDRVKKETPTLIISEGEIDALTFTEIGFDNAVSVPNGAPMKIVNKKIDPSEDYRFSYVWDARDMLDKMERVILATDNDPQGMALQEELARRIGKHKCWIVKYPDGCKDANDVLLKHGKVVLSDIIIDAKPFPISGLFGVQEFSADLETLYNKRSIRGASSGISALDNFYTVFPGQLTVVTGLPSHGKSSFIDQLTVNLAEQFQWKFAFCSFENTPTIHIAHLMELKARKPFFMQRNNNMERMTKEEYVAAMQWVEGHFNFIDFRDAEPPTIEAILQRAQAAVQRLGVRGVIIDPYNYVRMPRGASETDEISDMLTRVQTFAKANDCHFWFICHPTKMYGETSRPGGMQVHGSASWWAKADCGITIHRGQQQNESIIDVWKVRYRWVGQQGSATISYDPICGAFS